MLKTLEEICHNIVDSIILSVHDVHMVTTNAISSWSGKLCISSS